MKTSSIVLSVVLLSMHAAVAADAPAAPNSYQKGLAAVAAGDPVTAKAWFTKALQENPDNANARVQLDEVTRNAESISAKGRQTKFGNVMIDKIVLDKATLQESLDVLSSMVGKATKDQVSANFIFEDPKGTLAEKPVTLKLNGIPAKAVLEYILNQVGAKARFDEHAIVIRPIGG